jgi:hypothetical protein
VCATLPATGEQLDVGTLSIPEDFRTTRAARLLVCAPVIDVTTYPTVGDRGSQTENVEQFVVRVSMIGGVLGEDRSHRAPVREGDYARRNLHS